jgi:CheY-like chemotaxis protein
MHDGSIVLVTRNREALGAEGLLERRGDSIVTTATGTEALAIVTETSPRLVIFEQHLGDIDPAQFCRTIRDGDATRATSLLLVADEGDEHLAALCLAAGCNEVVHKPIDEADLDRKVAKLSAVPVRKELRTLVKLELSLEMAGHGFLGHSLNISTNGILVQTSEILAPEARVIVQFYLQHDPMPMRVKSQVVRAEFTGGAGRYGLQFHAIPDGERDRLAVFIERIRSSGGKP